MKAATLGWLLLFLCYVYSDPQVLTNIPDESFQQGVIDAPSPANDFPDVATNGGITDRHKRKLKRRQLRGRRSLSRTNGDMNSSQSPRNAQRRFRGRRGGGGRRRNFIANRMTNLRRKMFNRWQQVNPVSQRQRLPRRQRQQQQQSSANTNQPLRQQPQQNALINPPPSQLQQQQASTNTNQPPPPTQQQRPQQPSKSPGKSLMECAVEITTEKSGTHGECLKYWLTVPPSCSKMPTHCCDELKKYCKDHNPI